MVGHAAIVPSPTHSSPTTACHTAAWGHRQLRPSKRVPEARPARQQAILVAQPLPPSLSQQDQVHGAWPASTEPMVGVYSHAQPITQPSLRRLNCLQARRWDERDAERGRRR